MLVLSRKRDERIIIQCGSIQIAVMVIDIRHDKVRLGFDAPKDVIVHREEVFEAIKRERVHVAEAACDVAGAGMTQAALKRQCLESHKVQPPEDDQALLDKMEDERGTA